MNKNYPIIILVLLVLAVSCVPSGKVKKPYTIAFYNVENLFDTIDTPNKTDEEFLPSSEKEWNTQKYNKKITDLAHVLSRIDTVNLPVIIGVAEIENNLVLKDLVSDPQLKKAHYKIVWEDGPDTRGIDCALLYNPEAFNVLVHEMLPVKDQVEPDFITRDILYVKGEMGKEVFHVFVNHWPSRWGGEEASEPKRMLAAGVLRKKVDALFAADSMANIIIIGDMNDEPGNTSLKDILMAVPNTLMPKSKQLVNLMYDDYENELGSYAYRGEWDQIDNIIVSGALIIKGNGLKSKLDNGFNFHEPFMEYKNNRGEISPNRTYGRSYYGGISDHFPVYMLLE